MSTMATCQYYLKKTKNPRICAKKSTHTKFSFIGGIFPPTSSFQEDFVPETLKNVFLWADSFMKSGVELHLCHTHFGMIANQIKKNIGDFHSVSDLSQEWKLAQLISILQYRVDEFNQVTQESHSESVDEMEDEIKFIEARSEREVLDMNFQEAKRDGRYIDLTENSDIVEQKKGCPVCFEDILTQNMTFLQCAHPVCNECLSNIVFHNMAQQCPVCRHEF